jgi:hypothetical protein
MKMLSDERFLSIAIAVVAVIYVLTMTGCATRNLEGSQILTTTRICVLSLCENNERTDRIGDPSSGGGDVIEEVDEANSSDQGESADLDLPPI